MLHGFSGSRDELKSDFVKPGVFAHTAKKLSDAGYASLRIDFRGSGESLSDITFAQTTFEGQISDALAALEYLNSLDSVSTDKTYVIGWSQGGLVASAVAGRSNSVDVVALWNAVVDSRATFSGLFGEEVMNTGMSAATDQAVTVALPWGAEITLNGAFFDGIESFDVLSEIKHYTGPLLVAQGSKDEIVSPASANALISAHDGPEQLWTTDMDHVFNIFDSSEALDAMITQTIIYFNENGDR